MNHPHESWRRQPDLLLVRFFPLLVERELPGPVLDLAAGACRHGIFAAQAGLPVVCYDLSGPALEEGRREAARLGVRIRTRRIDLQAGGGNPLPTHRFGAVLVFRYLHRPLMPCIRKSLRPGGVLIYETYTEGQRRYGRPRNPDHLLRSEELLEYFRDWEIIHSFEGRARHPERECAQLVARKPPAKG